MLSAPAGDGSSIAVTLTDAPFGSDDPAGTTRRCSPTGDSTG
jgi:hypothetical protein